MKLQKVDLTKGEIYVLHMAVLAVNEKNKVDNYFDKSFGLVKKLLVIKKEFALDIAALIASGMTVTELFADKTTTSFNLPVFTEEEFEKMNFDLAKYEAFEKLLEVK